MKQLISKSLLFTCALVFCSQPAFAQQDQAEIIQKLQEQIQALQKQVDVLKEQSLGDLGPAGPTAAQLSGKSSSTFTNISWGMNQFLQQQYGLTQQGWYAGPRVGSASTGLRLGFYGESKYRWSGSGANTADAHRYVLTPSYVINDWLIFNSELELEHGAVAAGPTTAASRFDGELEIEQFYVDMLINDHLNFRSPGIGLIPMGRINLIHEPTTFYSTDRPRLYREIIPSTWFEPMLAGVWGKIVDGLDYQFFLTTGLEDLGVGGGITGNGGVRGGRPRLRRASENSLAYSGRLHYNGITGLDTSASFYATKIRGAGNASTLTLGWDVEALYRVPKTGLELRGDFAMWHFDNPEVFLANAAPGAAGGHDVGKRMFGWHVELAYHIWPDAWREGRGATMDLVPFIRYTSTDTQDGMTDGFIDTNNKEKYLTMGAAWFLNQSFVLKADMRRRVDLGINEQYQVAMGLFF